MVTRALAFADTYIKTPNVMSTTGYIFPAFTDGAVRLLANGAMAIETDKYYKSVEASGLEWEGDSFLLALTATINNRGLTMARSFIQRATPVVARTCYELFFQSVLKVNKTWAPWHVAVARQVRQLPVAADPEANLSTATAAVRAMRTNVLIDITLDFSSTLAGGVCDALVAVSFDGCSRAAASSTTNAEESLHERVYKLCGRRQPLMVAMSGAQLVDVKDVDRMESGRAAGAHTSVERGILAERRKEARRQKRSRESSSRDAPAAGEAADSDNGLLKPPSPSTRRPWKRNAVATPSAEAAAAATLAARRIRD
ncbi:hypothetical protein I4F81_001590 [Pyropia yezoensis]|uniref:Uncharacterized protein n=1 Tax=Pyropia yezoensis TaxID=2788 RepID=A0ACC3BM11_PYRYE|nr:hypothetical protein I4F81_001590 [Neopyropia yezoensis]